ncbi:SWIM zinc finger family protein [Streptomyces sp. NPDC058861]|uniref:SWIM zinc finger family protein n=1 Tax=Streptomyces sp. NPDC058861 TaxID=3346653 RepID=UPI0036AD5C54
MDCGAKRRPPRRWARFRPGPTNCPHCSCPDWGDPCKHAAALYYQVARLLDHDPFVLLLLRGGGEGELMRDLHQRNAAHTTAPAPLACPPGRYSRPPAPGSRRCPHYHHPSTTPARYPRRRTSR